jgi:hypothetical protein
MRKRRHPLDDLRLAVDCLPVHTREAMLEGVRSSEIIAGAYTDRDGGICPMLAAHRHGGRTSLIAFARAWDRFTDARRRARRATEREVRILTTQLEASLLAEDRVDLGAAIAEHTARLDARSEPAARPGDRDRSKELRAAPGWSWLRAFRRYDDYARALARVEEQAQAEREAPPAEAEPALR